MDSIIITWDTLQLSVSAEQLEKYIICIDYHAHDTQELFDWLDTATQTSIDNQVEFDTILVWADYDKLTGVEVIKLTKEFYMHGAMLCDYGNKVHDFNEAIGLYQTQVVMAEKVRKKIDNVLQQT